jgi:mannan endo-1,4-beta-mannosidase
VPTPCDANATLYTRNLLTNLDTLAGSRTLFGHQNAPLHGVTDENDPAPAQWSRAPGDPAREPDTVRATSSVRSSSRSRGYTVVLTTVMRPAVIGYDLAYVAESDAIVSGDPTTSFTGRADATDMFRLLAQEAFREGAVLTYSWHCFNPETNAPVAGGHIFDAPPGSSSFVRSVLGTHWSSFQTKLDRVADFFNSLQVDGVPIPVIFRPFHEQNGGWFWWGKDQSSAQEFVDLWRRTLDHLWSRGVHNMLVAFSPDKMRSGLDDLAMRGEYLERYPGDGYVDILGSDVYSTPGLLSPPSGSAVPIEQLKMVVRTAALSTGRNAPDGQGGGAAPGTKLAAWTEGGVVEGDPVGSTYFSAGVLAPWTTNFPVEGKFPAYALFWQNKAKSEYYVPYPNHPAVDDFTTLRRSPRKFSFLGNIAADLGLPTVYD